MKTIPEFMTKISGYFGGFQNQTVADMVANELRYIKPSDYDSLFRQITMTLPAAYKPDYKAIVDAIKSLRLEQLTESGAERTCKVCGTVDYTSGVCSCCKYDGGVKDGTPEEYRTFWENWKNGDYPRFNIAGIIASLESKAVEK